jgi:transcriptional regulator with XRE-family HTH domain
VTEELGYITNRRAKIMQSKEETTTNSVIRLIVEGEDGSIWGRVNYEDDLIVEQAQSVNELLAQMKIALKNLHGLDADSYEFELEYDLTAFFEQFDYLKITKVAEVSGLNGSLVRQYASGKKYPSAKQAMKIENAIKQLANDLLKVQIYSRPENI